MPLRSALIHLRCVLLFSSPADEILADLTPRNLALLKKRDEIQAEIDQWYRAHKGPIQDMGAYKAFLTKIGYLVPEGAEFKVCVCVCVCVCAFSRFLPSVLISSVF